MKSRGRPVRGLHHRRVKSKIQSIVFEEGQNFDRIVRQLDHIFQHFNKLKCIVHGETPEAVMGDVEIFEEREADGELPFFEWHP